MGTHLEHQPNWDIYKNAISHNLQCPKIINILIIEKYFSIVLNVCKVHTEESFLSLNESQLSLAISIRY
jgi:hypothetical protein